MRHALALVGLCLVCVIPTFAAGSLLVHNPTYRVTVGAAPAIPAVDRAQDAMFVTTQAKAPVTAVGLQARNLARKDALAQARRQLLAAAMKLKLTGYATVGDFFAAHLLPQDARGSLQHAVVPVADVWDEATRTLTLVAALPLAGDGTPSDLAAQVLAQEQGTLKDTGKLPEHLQTTMVLTPGAKPEQLTPAPYTGVIIDTTGMAYTPALVLKLVTVEGAEVWGTNGVTTPTVLQKGMFGVAADLVSARANRRAGTTPLIIRPLGTCGALHGDLVLRAEDVALLARPDVARALGMLSIVIITDKEGMAQ